MYISIHAPTNGATITVLIAISVSVFQSTLRRTERPDYSFNSNICLGISIHAPTNGATSKSPPSPVFMSFQSTLRRTERPDYSFNSNICLGISIHAPTNGATCANVISRHRHLNFNPRSDERSDNTQYQMLLYYYHFNPRSDERSDGAKRYVYELNNISIHAPTNGATHVKLMLY